MTPHFSFTFTIHRILMLMFLLSSCKQRKSFEPQPNALVSSVSKHERILQVTAEQTGIFNTGGLGHTVASLAGALQEHGYFSEVLMPYYSDLPENIQQEIENEHETFTAVFPNSSLVSESSLGRKEFVFSLFSVVNPENKVKTWLLKHEGKQIEASAELKVTKTGLFENKPPSGEGKRYTNHSNEMESFLAFSKAASAFILKRNYTIVNIHDWHTATVRMGLKGRQFLKSLQNIKFLFTISNMGYQGIANADLVKSAGLSDDEFFKKSEFYGQFNSMKYAMESSDFVLTVAPNYLKEISTKRFGGGLEGVVQKLLQENKISAILNGTNVEDWNPEKQYHKQIAFTFTPENMGGKLKGKLNLQRELGLEVSEKIPLYAFTSRIAGQKGYEYLPQSLEEFARKNNVQLVLLGDGEERYVQKVLQLAEKYPTKIKYFAFDANLEKPLTAYSDFFVNVPWYEPSGTNQLFAMKNGTIPILTKVGGLADFVQHNKTGLLAEVVVSANGVDTNIPETSRSILETLNSSIKLFQNNKTLLNQIRIEGMKQDNSWKTRMPQYDKLFESLRSQN